LADFNPDVKPVAEPNYLGWSKAIQQPEADKSAEYLLKGVGTALGEGIGTLDTFAKDLAVNEAQQKGTAVRDSFVSDLEKATQVTSSYADAWFDLSQLKHSKGDFVGALAAAKKVVDLNPKNASLAFALFFVAVILALLWPLYHKRIFVRV